MEIRKETTLNKTNNNLQIPNWHNRRSISELVQTFSLTNNNKNIFSSFLQHISDIQKDKYLTNTTKETKVLDIGCGQGVLLEELINYYDVTGIGISKYMERDTKNTSLKGIYQQAELKDILPNTIEDNSLDFIISLYTLQYIKDAPKLVQDIYNKLKEGGEALLSLGTPGHIDPRLLYYIEKHNQDSIIDSSFTNNISNIGFGIDTYDSSIGNSDIMQYKKNAGVIHILHIKKNKNSDKFHIPQYRTNKEIRYTLQDWKQNYPDYDKQGMDKFGQRRSNSNDNLTSNNYINLSTMSYTFSYIKD